MPHAYAPTIPARTAAANELIGGIFSMLDTNTPARRIDARRAETEGLGTREPGPAGTRPSGLSPGCDKKNANDIVNELLSSNS